MNLLDPTERHGIAHHDPKPTHADLTRYLLRSGIGHFSGAEVCTMRRIGTIVEPPPWDWWPRIIPALQFAEELRRRMGHALTVGNGYRPADMNRKVGGARFSAHIYFRALDLDLPKGEDSSSNRKRFYEEAVELWLELESFPLGLGLYSRGGGRRIHIDAFHKPFPGFKSRRAWDRRWVDEIARGMR